MKRNCVIMAAMFCMSLAAINVTAQQPAKSGHNKEAKPKQECCQQKRHPAGDQKPEVCPEKCPPATAIYSVETRAMMRADRMAAELNLSDDVKAQLVTFFTEQEKAFDQQRAAKAEQHAQEQKAREAQKAEYDKALEQIIGAENMQKLQQKHARKDGQRQPKPEGCFPQPKPAA